MPSTNWGSAANGKVAREGVCRCCGSESLLSRHHLVPQRWFRDNPGVLGRHNPLNIVPLCFHCHRVVDGHLPAKTHQDVRRLRRIEKRRILRSALTGEEIQYIVGLRGQAWVDHHYPMSTVSHDPVRSKPARIEHPTGRKHLPGCDFWGGCIRGCPVFGAGHPIAA